MTMRPLIPMAVLGLVGLLAFASLHDMALATRPLLAPWFGWMMP